MSIPKIIHQLWIGPKPAPINLMNTWKEKHPDFEYIFSQSFYDGTPTSLMEEVTLEYLKQLESKPNTLIALLNHSRTWNNLERFYYVPILALLIKRIVRKL